MKSSFFVLFIFGFLLFNIVLTKTIQKELKEENQIEKYHFGILSERCLNLFLEKYTTDMKCIKIVKKTIIFLNFIKIN